MNSRWAARLALVVSGAMFAGLLGVWQASGQTTEPLLATGIDVLSGTTTQATYEIVVTNFGTADATNVRVRSEVPANTTFESSTPAPVPPAGSTPGTPPNCDNGGAREGAGVECEWDLGSLAVGESKSITATYNLDQGESAYTVTLAAEAEADTGQTNSDSDASLKRDKIGGSVDTWVDKGEPQNTEHGTCEELHVRRDNQVTAFAKIGALPAEDAIENFFGADFRLTAETTEYVNGNVGTYGIHKIDPNVAWSEGDGDCTGDLGEGDQARTGFVPPSNGTPTGTGQVTGTEQTVRFTATSDLDSQSERSSFNGWEVRDQQSSGTGTGLTKFDSYEGDSGQTPRLFFVYETPEGPTCIDSDPEADTNNPSETHEVRARVTDGAKSESDAAGDACNGTPIAAKGVVFTIEDDDPDIWINSANGQPVSKTIASGDAGPNSQTVPTESNGIARITVILDEPGTDNTGDDRIGALIEGGEDVEEPESEEPACLLPVPVEDCDGEGDEEDDVMKTWDPAHTPGPTPSGSSPSPTQSSPSPTSTSTEPPPTSRSVTLAAEKSKVDFGTEVTLAGQIFSSDQSCSDGQEFIRIRRRVSGRNAYKDFDTDLTDEQGRFQIKLTADRSAEYVAIAPAHDNCADATSSPAEVLVKVKLRANPADERVQRGDSVLITGKVTPNHKGTKVLLQQRKGGGWQTIDSDELNRKSRFRLSLVVKHRGREDFRVLWPGKGHPDHEPDSDKFVIRGV